jgi:serine/threonine-protein kinase
MFAAVAHFTPFVVRLVLQHAHVTPGFQPAAGFLAGVFRDPRETPRRSPPAFLSCAARYVRMPNMQLPARIGKYELQEFLGGGMSHVYRARDTVIGRTVAVKILTEAGCQDAEAKARFLAEARMAGNISHDNILGIYDFGEDHQHRPFMVMEYLQGEDLGHAIKAGHTGELRDKLKMALQIARALEYTHSRKIIHRDIKPDNVHVGANGVVKLMDFGIAKTESLQMTRAGYVLGTPYYMAPEQVTGQGVTAQVDVYAFGVLLYELLTGVKPVAGETVERIFYSILNETIDVSPLRQAGVPESVCDIVTRCTLKDPAARPQGFGPVCASLESILAEIDAPTTQLPGIVQPRPAPARPAWLLPVVLLVVLGLGLGLYFAVRPRQLAPFIEAKSGRMVLVPAGLFLYGKEKKPSPLLPAFYIDRTEVTNAAYAAFCRETHHALPDGFPRDKEDYPVVNVTFLDAAAFANWAGESLPGAMQWEKAARGADGRLFPWGDRKDASRANIGPDGQLRPAADFASGASPFGALQMIGNVWEFVFEPMTPSDQALHYFREILNPPPMAGEGWYQIRGGSFKEGWQEDQISDSTTVPARWKDANIGFRCVRAAR